MNLIEKFNNDNSFRNEVLKLENEIDFSIVENANNINNIKIKAPVLLTLEHFEILWKRYKDAGWDSFSWEQESGFIFIMKNKIQL